jgi:hypothetical protein
VMVRGRNDLDHEINGQCGDANQGRAQERFHFPSNLAIDSCIWYYQVIRSLSRRGATVKRLGKEIFR